LLRLCAGLVPLHRGAAVVLGHDLATRRREVRRGAALVGHESACYDDLTVSESLAFASRAAGRGAGPVGELVDRLGLGSVASVVHRRLSAGQRRRLSLGVALAREPRLLLLDEPHAGLDDGGRRVLDGLVAGLAAEGRTVVLASHELDRARALATRELRLVNGRIDDVVVPDAGTQRGGPPRVVEVVV
jgi:ABC-type multidrug transport system ATPase subunit